MRLFYILFTWFLLSHELSGQVQTIPEPEYIGNIVFVDSGHPKALEKQKASTKTKAGASMYIVGAGKIKSSNVVEGARSPIRILKRDSIQFIVRVANNDMDPFQLFNIFKLDQNQNKNTRYIEIGSLGTFSGASSNDISFIPFQAKKVR